MSKCGGWMSTAWCNAVDGCLKCLLLVEVEESHGDGGTMRDRGSVRYVVGSYSSGSSSGDSDGDCPAPGLQDYNSVDVVAD